MTMAKDKAYIKERPEAVNWVKEHVQELWKKYPFTLKLKEEEKES